MTKNERILFITITGHMDGYMANTDDEDISVSDFLAYVETMENEPIPVGEDPQAELNPSEFQV